MKKIISKTQLLIVALVLVFVGCQKQELNNPISNSEYNSSNTNNIKGISNKDEYYSMMLDLRNNIDAILDKVKPVNQNLQNFKDDILNGKVQLSEEIKSQIMSASKNLIQYGQDIAYQYDIDIDPTDEGQAMALGGFYNPCSNFNIVYPPNTTLIVYYGTLTWGEVGACAATAIGADLLWALPSSGVIWTVASLTTAFTAVASKFLGPIGVTIAVVSFGVCLANAASN